MSRAPAPESALGELEKIHAVLSTARRLTEDGRAVDLSAVDARIRKLCAEVEGLPVAQGRTLAPALTALIAEFDSLAQTLTDRFGGLPSLGDLATAKDAAAIYGKTTKHFP
ncbi:MAG: hypothetical protein SFV19_21085 [Rhodospirillaceae bacterium]|nr:hypothetical protein [Rhodospirillaceae bacterium]